MSRILKVMIVLLTIAAMVTPVMAEDRLSLNGQMRVRGWHLDDGGDYTDSYFDQRLRIGGKLSIAEGVSVTFRFDETEAKWGTQRPSDGANRQGVRFIESETGMQWDRAHLDLDFGTFKLRAGQYYAGGFSASDVVNAQDAGFMVTAGPVKAFWQLDSNDGGTDSSDFYLWGVDFGQKIDTIKYNAFVAGHKMNDYEVYLVGADVALNIEAIKVLAEINYFTGDADADTDAMGLQGWADVSFAATEVVTIGGQVYYAIAADDDEVQIDHLGNDFGGWDPLADVGNGLSNEELKIGRPFDLFGDDAGVMALRGYANVKATESLAIGAGLTYAQPEDDGKTEADSALIAVAGASYDLMANTKLDAIFQYVDVDAPDTDSAYGVGVGLFVNF